MWAFDQDIDVAAQLVSLGHAVYVDTARSMGPSSDAHSPQVNGASAC